MNLHDFLSDPAKVSDLYDKYSNILPPINIKCGCPFHGSKDSFNMYVDNRGIIRGHCFSDCDCSYNIIDCISKFGNIPKSLVYERLLLDYQVDLGNKTIMSIETKLLNYQKTLNITNNKNYQYLINERKLDNNTILRNKLILLNKEQVLIALDNDPSQINILVGTLKSNSEYLQTSDDMLNYVFGRDSIVKLILGPDYDLNGISCCFPFNEKKDRYRHIKTINSMQSPLNAPALKNTKSKKALMLTEGLFSYLVVDKYYNDRSNVVALMGTAFKDVILEYVDRYQTIVLALDCDSAGRTKTVSILNILKNIKYKGKILIYYDIEYSAIDDYINSMVSFSVSNMRRLISVETFNILLEAQQNGITMDMLMSNGVHVDNYNEVLHQLSRYKAFNYHTWYKELQNNIKLLRTDNVSAFKTTAIKILNDDTNYNNIYSLQVMFKKLITLGEDNLYPSININNININIKEITRENFGIIDNMFGNLLLECNFRLFIEYVVKNDVNIDRISELLEGMHSKAKYLKFTSYYKLKYNK